MLGGVKDDDDAGVPKVNFIGEESNDFSSASIPKTESGAVDDDAEAAPAVEEGVGKTGQEEDTDARQEPQESKLGDFGDLSSASHLMGLSSYPTHELSSVAESSSAKSALRVEEDDDPFAGL